MSLLKTENVELHKRIDQLEALVNNVVDDNDGVSSIVRRQEIVQLCFLLWRSSFSLVIFHVKTMYQSISSVKQVSTIIRRVLSKNIYVN